MQDHLQAGSGWYLFREGRQSGPISYIELLRLVEVGQVRGGDLLWKPGLSDWVIAEAVLPEITKSASAPEAKRPATKTTIKKKQSSLLADLVGSLFNPILRFYRTAYDVTVTPTNFALHHIHLNDRTNFFRGVRFYAQAFSYQLALIAGVRLISKQPILSSDIGMVFVALLLIVPLTFIYFGASKLFLSRSISLRNVVHIETYVFGAAAAFSGLYFVTFAITEFILEKHGVTVLPEAFADPFATELNKCLSKRSVAYLVLIGDDPAVSTNVSAFATVIRTGLPWTLLFVIPGAKIITALFDTRFVRSLFWITFGTIVGYVVFSSLLMLSLLVAIIRSDCNAEAYYHMGEKDPNGLLMHLERSLSVFLPLKIDDEMKWVKVEAGTSELSLYYEVTDTDAELTAGPLTKIWQNIAIQAYCTSDLGTVDYVVALRKLGIPVRTIRNINNGQIVIDVVAKPADCGTDEGKQ